jgi:N-acetylneuraminic acid mutarotase
MKLLNNALNKKLCLLVLCFLGIKPFCSAVPMLISFQGHVLKESRPFEGTGQFKFAVVDQGGMTLWRNDGLNANGEPAQSIGIQVVRGVFAVTLGDDAIANMAALNSGVFDQDYISIRIWFDAGDGVFEQLSPDTRITAVGFALKAKTVDELPDGIVSKANLVQALKDAIDLNTAKVSITSDQGDTISTNTASIGTNATAISAESTRAQAAETTNATNISGNAGDISTNTASIGTNATAISAESTRAQAAETTNATNISGNAGDITTNTASIGTNATAISAESTRAQAAEIENTVEIAQLKQHVNTSSGGTGVVVASGSKSDGSLVGQGYTQITNIEAPPWRNGIANGQPSRRHRHAGDWTGSRFLVWGGNLGGNYYSQDGGIYDPAKDVWSQISTFGSPAARDSHTAVWSGSGLIVWGGYGQAGYLASGGGFNPATGDWRSLETLGQPSPRIGHVSVLGRNNLLQINLAGGYALERAIYVDNLVQGVELNEGDKLVFSGGGQLILTASASTGTTVLNGHLTGGDLADNEKGYLGNQEVVTINNSNGYTLVRQVTVDSLDSPLSSGAVAWFSNGASLELTQNASSMDTQIHGIQRNGDLANNDVGHRHLIPIWGGKNSEGLLGDGAVYDPLADTWTAINNSSAPGKRTGHTAVWLNGELLVWGGDGETGVLNTGGRYSFAGDSWTALPTAGAPSARRGHTAISTGSTMIVWGGEAQDSLLASGSVFDPSGNSGLGSWSSMSTSNAPVARSGHSAVWTGSEMIIYGGKTVDAEDNTAAAYNPATDSWRQLTMEGPPLARKNHLAVWSGEEMLVFGGLLNGQPVGALQKLVPKQNWYLYRKN